MKSLVKQPSETFRPLSSDYLSELRGQIF